MLVMAIFTFLWGLGPLFVWRAAGLPVAVFMAGVTGFLILAAFLLLHQTRHFPFMTSPDDRVQAARTWRLFGITFAVEGLVIAIVSTVLSIADLHPGRYLPAPHRGRYIRFYSADGGVCAAYDCRWTVR